MKRWMTVVMVVMLVCFVNACGDSAAEDESAKGESAPNKSESQTTADPALSENEFAQLMLSIGSYCGSVICAQKQYKKTMTCTSGTSAKGASVPESMLGMISMGFIICDDWDATNATNSTTLKVIEFCGQKFIDDEKAYSENVQFTLHSALLFCKQTNVAGSVEVNKALMSPEKAASSLDLLTQIFCKNFDHLLNNGQ